jgi:hypothetical protein
MAAFLHFVFFPFWKITKNLLFYLFNDSLVILK